MDDEKFEWDIGEAEFTENIRCVVCPFCAFTFDADHIDDNNHGSTYSCPNCQNIKLLQVIKGCIQVQEDEDYRKWVAINPGGLDGAMAILRENKLL